MKSYGCLFLLLLCFVTAFAQQATPPGKPFDAGIRVGQKIPPFRLKSQEGKELDFNRVKGPKGAALVFFRSADW